MNSPLPVSSLLPRAVLSLELWVFLLASLAASAQVINTVAGNGSVGDGGPATSANISLPYDVAVDSAGNLYIADSGNNRIRKVSAGVISTVAGNGTPGFYGDGGPATSAALFGPTGVTVDGMGNIYIADNGNNVIRKVDTAGVITTIAGNGTFGFSGDGGPASGAALGAPIAVAADAAGNVYIADSLNNRIRKVNTAGVITTVAGDGVAAFSGDGGTPTSAALNYPDGVALDGAGNLYIADSNNNRIRKVNTGGVITTVAGNGTFGYSGDGGQATSAGLSGPAGVALDSTGNIYIADYYNDVIRRVNTGGVINTVAGDGLLGFFGDGGPATSAAFNGPIAVALDGAGNLYIADYYNNRVREVNTVGVIRTIAGDGDEIFSGDGGPATSAQLDSPNHAAPDNVGDFYIADFLNDRIRKVNAAGVISTVAGNGTFSYSGDGGLATNAEFYGPRDVAVDGAGNLYIADLFNNRVREVNTGGIINTLAGNGTAGYSGDGGPAASAELYDPGGVAVDGAGNVYISDSGNNRIRKVNVAGVISTVAGNGTAGYSGDGGPATSAELDFPSGIAVDTAGNLYIADTVNNRIRKANTTGTISTVAGSGEIGFFGDGGAATHAGIDVPTGVAVDGAGNVYIADAGNNRIREVNAAGIISTVAGNGAIGFSGDSGPAILAELWSPSGVALDNEGNLYISDTGNNRIRQVSPAGPSISATPNSLSFSASLGGSNPSSQTVTVSNPGTGTINWTVTASTSSGGNWLSVSPGSGINSGAFTVSVTIAGLTQDTYSGTITVAAPQASNTPQTITVQLVVQALNASPPEIGLGSSSLFFGASPGGSNPSSQSVSVFNLGTGALNWTTTASTSSGGNWLSVSPGSGTNSGTLTTSVNVAGLTANTYNGAITVAATGASNTPQNIAVTLTVTSQGIFSGGTVNAASLTPGAAVAPGSIAAVFGEGLPALTSASSIPLPTNLAGVSVAMNGVPAPLFVVAAGPPSQINLQVPWELSGQSQASLVASINGTPLAPVTVPLAPAAPGIFTINAQGTGQGAIIDDGPVAPIGAVAAPAGSIQGRAVYPAAPGDIVTIYCTGLGSVTDPPATGAAGNGQPTTASPIVTIGGLPATVSFAGLVPTLVGEYQINVQVPTNAPAGNAVPVSFSIDGVSSNVVTMAIQ